MSIAPYLGTAEWTPPIAIEPSDGLSNVCKTASGKIVRARFFASSLSVHIEFADSLKYVLEHGAFQTREYLLSLESSNQVGTVISLIEGKLYLVLQYGNAANKVLKKDLYVDTTGEGHAFSYVTNMITYDAAPSSGILYGVIPAAIITKLSNGILCSPFVRSYITTWDNSYPNAKSYAGYSTDGGLTWTHASRYSSGYSNHAGSSSSNLIETADGYVMWRNYTQGAFSCHAINNLSYEEHEGVGFAQRANRSSANTFCRFGSDIFAYVGYTNIFSSGGIWVYTGPAEATHIDLANENNWIEVTPAELLGNPVMLAFEDCLIVASGRMIQAYYNDGTLIHRRARNAYVKTAAGMARARSVKYKDDNGNWGRVAF